MTPDWSLLAWPRSRLGEAITFLARRSGLDPVPVNLPPPPKPLEPDSSKDDELGDWVFSAAQSAGIDIKPVGCLYPELRQLLRESGPSIIGLTGEEGSRFLLLLKGSSRKVRLLGTDLDVHTLSVDVVHEALCSDIESPIAKQVDALLDQAGVSETRRAKSRSLMMKERLSRSTVGEGWLLRHPPGDKIWPLARSVSVPRNLFLFASSYTTQYLLWILSWWVIGKGILAGRLDAGWLLAWGLCLLSQIPFLLWSSLYQSLVEIGVGGLLKQRLLQGALQLHPDEMRHDGAGHHLGRVLESEAVEKMVLSGGFVTLASSIELLGASIVLSLGSGGLPHALLLFVWLGLTVLLGRRYLGQRRAWADGRLGISHDIIEKMVGHRSRLAQQQPQRWHETEDQELERYLDTSSKVDRTAAIMTLIPRGWLVVGLFGLAPAFVIGGADPAGLAIGLGGVILSFRAMRRFTNGFEILVDAAVAWRQVAPLFQAAARARSPGDPAWSARTLSAAPNDETTTPLVEADDLVFSFRDRADPVLSKCSFRIGTGDRILLESPSGGGKSTLVSLLNGLRAPGSGLLLLHGLDQRSLGDEGWTKRIAAAPQFHENHVITETFLFNLLMGRRWPPPQEDIDEAKTLCHELGLGPLLEHMPAGLLQMVGDTGWQLSHGEKSRLYLARALLQRAELAVLDESFAALDPDNLKTALECARRRAGTLLVIAHP